jgi:flagella synthesis protein FlgN
MGPHRTDRGAALGEFDTLIGEQTIAAQHLLKVLQSETSALGRRDADALALAAADKTLALEVLEDIERRRRDLCGRLGVGPGSAGMTAWLSAPGQAAPGAPGVVDRWQALQRLLRDCQKANRANGMAVATLQRRVQQAMNLIRTGSTEPAVYGPTGSAAAGVAPRAIARA